MKVPFPGLLILSDLWGNEDEEYIQYCKDRLRSNFTIRIVDVLQSAGIVPHGLDKSQIHTQLINGGADVVIDQISNQLKGLTTILGFSIGGFIGWKLKQKFQMQDIKLYAVSSTRFRTIDMNADDRTFLWFGSNDPYRPNMKWMIENSVNPCLVEGADHMIYKDLTFLNHVCNRILINQLESYQLR